MVAYLEAVSEDGDPGLLGAALGDIPRANGAMQIAQDASLTAKSFNEAPSPARNN
jgi:DNA-binding phage protein